MNILKVLYIIFILSSNLSFGMQNTITFKHHKHKITINTANCLMKIDDGNAAHIFFDQKIPIHDIEEAKQYFLLNKNRIYSNLFYPAKYKEYKKQFFGIIFISIILAVEVYAIYWGIIKTLHHHQVL